MRQLRHLLGLHHDGVNAREIGRRLGVARSTIQDNLKRAEAAGLAWPLAGGVTDDALEREFFGRAGVAPKPLVPDNLKSWVNKASFYDPEINCTYGAIAAHYSVGILPARPRRPRDKTSASYCTLSRS
jgi:transposase